jgi:hypothetical protein
MTFHAIHDATAAPPPWLGAHRLQPNAVDLEPGLAGVMPGAVVAGGCGGPLCRWLAVPGDGQAVVICQFRYVPPPEKLA